jgi:hypothetical protein
MTRRTATKSGTALASNLMLAPAVMWMRLPALMAEAGASGTGFGVETTRAVTEKAAAMAQGLAAAQMSAMGAAMRFWPELLSGRTPSMLNGAAAERMVHAALKPAGRHVRSNYRRLSSPARAK